VAESSLWWVWENVRVKHHYTWKNFYNIISDSLNTFKLWKLRTSSLNVYDALSYLSLLRVWFLAALLLLPCDSQVCVCVCVCVTSVVWFIKNMQKRVSFIVRFNILNTFHIFFMYEVCCMWGSTAVCSICLLVLKRRKYLFFVSTLYMFRALCAHLQERQNCIK
jgi:hypothetical protein